MSDNGAVTLHAKRQKAVLRRHPWVFSGAVDRIEGSPGDGNDPLIDKRDGPAENVGSQ